MTNTQDEETDSGSRVEDERDDELEEERGRKSLNRLPGLGRVQVCFVDLIDSRLSGVPALCQPLLACPCLR